MDKLLSSRLSRLVLALTILMLNCPFVFGASAPSPIFKRAIPESGASFSHPDITLEFDISGTLAELPAGKYGIGYRPSASSRYIKIYEGTEENGVLVADCSKSEWSVTKSNGNLVEGNKVKLNLPHDLFFSPGKTYTVKITTSFFLYDMETGNSVSSAKSLTKDPIILTYTGREPLEDELFYKGTDIDENAAVESLGEYRFTFTQPVKPVAGAKALLTDGSGNEMISGTLSTDSSDSNVIVASFPDRKLRTTYYVVIPSGSVEPVSGKAEPFGSILRYALKGTYKDNIMWKVTEMSDIYRTDVQLGFPEGYYGKGQSTVQVSYYEGEEVTGEPFTKQTIILTSGETGIMIPGKSVSLLPSTKYTVVIGEFSMSVETESPDGLDKPKSCVVFSPEQKFTLTTGSVEKISAEEKFPQLKWGKVYQESKFNYKNPVVITEGMEIAGGSNLKLGLEGLYYKPDANKDRKWEVSAIPGKMYYLYEIMEDGSEVLLKENSVSTVQVEDMTTYFNLASIAFGQTFYAGHTYKITVPEGAFGLSVFGTVTSSGIGNHPALDKMPLYFTPMPEFSIVLKGSTPTSIGWLDCSVNEGDELSEIREIRLHASTRGVKGEDITAKISYPNDSAIIPIVSRNARIIVEPCPLSRTSKDPPLVDQTLVILDFKKVFYETPFTLEPGLDYTLTIDAGLLHKSDEPEVKTPEYVVHFKGAKKSSVDPEMYKVTLSIEGAASTVTEITGNASAVFTLAPDAFWEIESVRFNGEDVTSEVKEGKYATPALTGDSEIVASLRYTGELVFVDTDGIASIPDSNVKISCDKDAIVIDGLTGNEKVTVYSVSGLMIGAHEATSPQMRITAERGNTYIVRVDNKAAKIMLAE